MGGNTGSTNWRPPPEPAANTASGPVDYHMVGSQVVFSHTSECGCCPRVQVDMDCEQLYHMLAQQFTRGYRMLYFTRMPGDMHILIWSQTMRVCFSGFFRMNPNLGERYDSPVSWQLRIDRCWFQATIEKTGGFFSLDHRRTVDTANIVACIGKNTHHGERLVAAAVTGHALTQSFGELQGGLGPHLAMDLFFEVPSPPPGESYLYNIALSPVHVDFDYHGFVFFPNIPFDWMGFFNHHLRQGWRLIDIYIDFPMVEQLRTPQKQKRRLCCPTDTNALWFFEKPRSREVDTTPMYEGTIVEQQVPVWSSKDGHGVQSQPDWVPVIRDMGSRGWELACVLECHSVDSSGWTSVTIKSLLFFQRPIAH